MRRFVGLKNGEKQRQISVAQYYNHGMDGFSANRQFSFVTPDWRGVFSLLMLSIGLLLFPQLAEAATSTWNGTDWQQYVTLTIDSDKVDDDLTDFPVYVDLTDLPDEFWNVVADNGGDIRVTTGDTNTELPRELVSISTSTQTGELHFKANSVSSTTDTTFRIYVNGSSTAAYAQDDTYGAQNVWTNDYIAVYHMQEDPGGGDGIVMDSTINSNNGTSSGGMTTSNLVSGQIGSAIEFDGVDDFIEIAADTSLNPVNNIDFSVSAWMNWEGAGGADTEIYIQQRDGSGTGRSWLFVDDAATHCAADSISTFLGGSATCAGVVANSDWQHTVVNFTDNRTSDGIQFYIDGLQEGSGTKSFETNSGAGVNIGSGKGVGYFTGVIDSVKISSTTRSAAWVSAEYTNQSTSTDFYSVEVPWNSHDWQQRVSLTIDSTHIDDDLTDFPVYVDLSDMTSAFWSGVRSDCGDIRVMNSDLSAELPREVVACDTTERTGELHFKADAVSSTTDTTFYLYFNGSTPNYSVDATYGAQAVWDDYLLVSHDGGSSDSTSNGNDGTPNSVTPGDVTGNIGIGTSFDGSTSDYIEIPGLLGVPLEATITGWVDMDASAGTTQEFVSLGDSLALRARQGGDSVRGFFYNGSTWSNINATEDLAGTGWRNIAYSVTDGSQALYVDGSPAQTDSISGDIVYGNGSNTQIGRHGDGQDFNLNGATDEIRVYGGVLSSNWISAEHNNQSSPEAFYSVADDWYDYDFSYRKAITIDADQVAGNETDFPVLINHTDSDLSASARSDGADIVFTSGDGATKLSHELESYTSGTGEVIAWVKAPSISSTTDTTLYMYYGNSATSSTENAADVWDDYDLVSHDGGATDSGPNGMSGTVSGATLTTGKIGEAYSFDGVNDEIEIDHDQLEQSFTVSNWSMWAEKDSSDNDGPATLVEEGGSSNGFEVMYRTSPDEYRQFYGTSDSAEEEVYNSTITEDEFVHLLFQFDNGTVRQYENGVLVGSSTHSIGTSVGAHTGTTGIAGESSDSSIADAITDTDINFPGRIDEVRRRGNRDGTVLSATWIKTEYNNQSSPETFYTTGTEESVTTLNADTYSGTLYEADRETAYSGTATVTLAVATGTVSTYSTTTSNGAWSITNIPTKQLTATSALVFYVDDTTGVTGATVAKQSTVPIGAGDIKLYRNHVAVRTLGEDDTITSRQLAQYDNDDDPDLPYTATTSTTSADWVTVEPNHELYVAENTTFAPVGGVTINGAGMSSSTDGSLTLAASSSYIGTSDDLSLAGSFNLASTSRFYPHASGTRFTATTSGKILGPYFPAHSEQYGLDHLGAWHFVGAGGAWTITGDATTTDFTIATGTVYNRGDLSVKGDFTNYGSYDSYGSTLTMGPGEGALFASSTTNFIENVDISSAATNPNKLIFKPDGTKMYVEVNGSNNIYEFTLSTPWDPGSFSATGAVFDKDLNGGGGDGMFFRPDGKMLFTTGVNTDAVFAHPLTTAWDLSTAGSSTASYSVASEETFPVGLTFKPDGTKLYVIGQTDDSVVSYTLRNPWDISSSSIVYDGAAAEYSVNSESGTPNEVVFGGEGHYMYVSADSPDAVLTYELSTPWDPSSASLLATYYVSSQQSAVRGMSLQPDGSKVFVVGTDPDIISVFSHDGAPQSLLGDLNDQNALGNVTFTGSSTKTLLSSASTTDFTTTFGSGTTTIPAGIDLTIRGDLVNYGTLDGAYANYTVGPGVGNSTEIADWSTGVTSSFVGDLPNYPLDIHFSFKGKKLYLMDSGSPYGSNGKVVEYDLSDPWDITSASTTGATISLPGGDYWGLSFAPDGSKLYFSGPNANIIRKYVLSEPWNLATAEARSEFDLTIPNGNKITFSPDGKYFLSTFANDDLVREYELEIPWDTSTATATGETLTISDATVAGITYSADGDSVYIVDNGQDILWSYNVSEKWRLKDPTLSRSEAIANFIPNTTTASGLYLTPDGTSLFVTEGNNESVHEIEISEADQNLSGDFVNAEALGDLTLTGSSSKTFQSDASTTDFTIREGSGTTSIPAGVNLSVGGDFTQNGTLDGSYANYQMSGTHGQMVSSSTITQTGASFSVAAETGTPIGFQFRNDGRRLYVLGQSNREIYTYALSTPWDLDSAGAVIHTEPVSAETSVPIEMRFRPDGKFLYILDNSTQELLTYELVVPWDMSSAIDTDKDISLSSVDTAPSSFYFTPDGSSLYVMGDTGDDITRLTLGTPWDITTAAVTSDVMSVAGEDSTPITMLFSDDGRSLYMLGYDSDILVTYTLSTPWDITTSSLQDTYSVAGEDSIPSSLYLRPDGQRMYLLGDRGNDVTPYTISPAEQSLSGTFTGTSALGDITLSGSSSKTFLSNASTTDFIVAENSGTTTIPAGMKLSVGGDFENNSIFRGAYAEYAFGNGEGWDIASGRVTYLTTTSLGTGPQGAHFKPDGTKLYSADKSQIYQYSLSTPWDVTTRGSLQTYSVSGQISISQVRDVSLRPDGEQMYVLATGGDRVYVYDLAAAWDVTSAAYTGVTLHTGSQDGSPTGLVIAPDGKTAFVLGQTTDTVYSYTLQIPWDFSTAAYDSVSFDVGTNSDDPQALGFSPDGDWMYVTDENNKTIESYKLSSPWDISTAQYVPSTNGFSTASQDCCIRSIDFKPDGTKLFLSGVGVDDMFQYSVSPSPQTISGTVTGDNTLGSVTMTGSSSKTFTDAASTTDFTVATSSGTTTAHVDLSIGGDFVSNSVFDGGYGTQIVKTARGWDITTNSVNTTVSVASEIGVTAEGLEFGAEGTKMYVSDLDTDEVYQYTLSTPWDVSTATYDNKSFDTSGIEAQIQNIRFRPDGKMAYFLGSANNDIVTLQLVVPWDISTAYVASDSSFSVASEATAAQDLWFAPDGTRFILSDLTTDTLYQYDLSTPWDITTASYNSVSQSIAAQGDYAQAISISSDGTRMTTFLSAGTAVDAYTMSTPWDLSTLSYANAGIDLSSQVNTLVSGYLRPDGCQLYALDRTNEDITIYDLDCFQTQTITEGTSGDLSLGNLTSANATTTTISGNATISDLRITNGTLIAPNTLTLRGNYTNTGGIFDANGGEVVFSDDALGFDVSTATVTAEYDVSQDTSGAQFGSTVSDDGRYAYVVNRTSNVIDQYTMSTPWDLSTISYTRQYNIAQDGRAIAFGRGGTRMYFVDSREDVREYHLDIPWNVSTAKFVYEYDTTSNDGNATGIAFNKDGTKMLIAGNSGDDIDIYTLSTPWDVSTASFNPYTGSKDISGQSGNPTGIDFSNDGTKFYVIDAGNRYVFEYEMGAPYDVANMTYSGRSYYVGDEELSPIGLSLAGDGRHFYFVGDSSDKLYEYTLGPAPQIATGTMTGTSAFHDLTVENTAGAGSSSQSVIFGTAASTTGSFSMSASTSAQFAAGETYTFDTMVLAGTAQSTPVWLRSSTSGSTYNFDVTNSSVNFADVKDSDATLTSGGIEAYDSTNSGNNTNWTFSTATSGPVWTSENFTDRIAITIDHTKVDSDLSDFPVYVDLADITGFRFWDTVRSDCGDIRIMNSSLTTEMAREVVACDTTAETGELHFKADTISSTADTTFYIYFNGTAADYASTTVYGSRNVWTNNYAAVWHLSETNVQDSTANENHGTAAGSLSLASGQLDQSINFSGGSITVPNASSLQVTGDLSISMWTNRDTSSVRMNPLYKSYGAEYTITHEISDGYSMFWGSSGSDTTPYSAFNDNGSITLDAWEYSVFTRNNSTKTAQFFKNGINLVEETNTEIQNGWVTPTVSTNPVVIGDGYVDPYDGTIDEIRISSAVRSAAWVAAEYDNQNDPTSFYTLTYPAEVTLSNHDAGQADNLFAFKNKTQEPFFRFKLSPSGDTSTTTNLELAINGVQGIEDGEVSNFKLYRDSNSNGDYDSGEPQVGGAGVLNLNGQRGTLTFSENFLATTSQNYVVVGDTNGIDGNDALKLSLTADGITGTSVTEGGAAGYSGSVTELQHLRNVSGGGGSSSSVGGSAPEGDGDVGGGGSEGGEVIVTTVSNFPDGFSAPTDACTPNGEFPSDSCTSYKSSLLSKENAVGEGSGENSYTDFGLSVPETNEIVGIEVRVRAYLSSGSTPSPASINLSWDDGTSTTSSKTTENIALIGSGFSIVTAGGSTDLWGRTWTASDFNNDAFLVNVDLPSDTIFGTDTTFNWVAVKIYHQATGGGSGGGGSI